MSKKLREKAALRKEQQKTRMEYLHLQQEVRRDTETAQRAVLFRKKKAKQAKAQEKKGETK